MKALVTAQSPCNPVPVVTSLPSRYTRPQAGSFIERGSDVVPLTKAYGARGTVCGSPAGAIAGFQTQHLVAGIVLIDEELEAIGVPTRAGSARQKRLYIISAGQRSPSLRG